MPPNSRQGRPGESGPNTVDDQTDSAIVTRTADIPAQVRRRGAAAWRLEPLDDGRRDPDLERTDWDAVLADPPDWGESAVFRDGRMIAVRDLAVVA